MIKKGQIKDPFMLENEITQLRYFFNGDICASENNIIEEEAIKEKHNSTEGIIFNFLLQ